MNDLFSTKYMLPGIGMFLVACAGLTQAETTTVHYPFEVSEPIVASVSVNTGRRVPVNPMLLGLNASWPEGKYGKIGYNHPDAQKLIRSFRPSSLRFPHGVWANFYDWESDGRRMTDTYKTLYDDAVRGHPDLKYGFDGLHALHKDLGFDVVFTFNVNYDSPEKSARRLMDRKERGFDVKWVELGNEPFWKTQRSEAIKTQEEYIAVSKAHAVALKAVDPDVKVSVPVHWRQAVSNPWNQPLMSETYFDAITIHKHLEGKNTPDGLRQTLFTGQVLSELADTFRGIFPNHPIWLTEWSTGHGEHAISVLGMVDGYLTLFENQDKFEVADYFQLNAGHPLIQYDKKTGVHTKTGFGAAYEMVRDMFEGAQLMDATTETHPLAEGKDAVRAVAVAKEDKAFLFVINKAPVGVPLQVRVDGRPVNPSPTIRALYFEEVNEAKRFVLDERPDTKIPLDSNRLILPPLSISRIEL